MKGSKARRARGLELVRAVVEWRAKAKEVFSILRDRTML